MFSDLFICYTFFFISNAFQKQPSRGFLGKRFSENIQQIYRRTPMSKCDFNNVAKQLCWNCTSALVFSCKVAAYFQNTFSWKYLWMALLLISAVNLQCFIENASISKNLNSIFLLVAGISISISCTKTAKRYSLSFYLTFSLTDLCEEITLIILANVPSKKTFQNIKLETFLPSSKPLQDITTRNAEIK